MSATGEERATPARRPEGGYRPGGGSSEGGQGAKRPGLMSKRRRKKVCVFCKDKTASAIDYKAADKIKRFISDRGKMLPRRIAGTCARHHRELSTVIRRARTMALLPYIGTGERTERYERGERYDRGERGSYDRGPRGPRSESSR